MKKLMIAAAVAMAAIASQAASIKWASGTMFAPADSKGTKSTEVKASGGSYYVINVAESVYTSLIAMDYATASAKIWETYGGSNLPETADKSIGVAGTATVTETLASGQTKDWAVAILTFKDTAGDLWYIANTAAAENTGTGSVTAGDLGVTWKGKDPGAIGSWTKVSAVPEPTSGLLLLLGIGAMALRRRRA